MKFKKLIRYIADAYRESRPFSASDDRTQKTIGTKALVLVLMAITSFVCSVMNFIIGNTTMLILTLALTLGFAVSALLAGVFRKWTPAAVIVCVMISVFFTYFALSGANEGFAVLWILLVPPIAMSLIGLRPGTVIGLYFQILLIVLYYTPLRYLIEQYYPITFIQRFPILYAVLYMAALLLAMQREVYFYRAERAARTDTLTGLSNRFVYETKKTELMVHTLPPTLVIVSCDINGLKKTNDALGHAAGDELITETAKCLTEAFGDPICICRTGGDEFSILTTGGKTAVLASIETFRTIAAHRNGQFISSLSASFGIAVASEHPALLLSDLEKVADAAMYDEKKKHYMLGENDRRAR